MLGYDKRLRRKAKAAVRQGSRLLVSGRDALGYFSVFKLGKRDELLGVTTDEKLVRSLREYDWTNHVHLLD